MRRIKFSAWNRQAIYAWGTEKEAVEYLKYLYQFASREGKYYKGIVEKNDKSTWLPDRLKQAKAQGKAL
jgi:hypothetical protein